MGGRAKGEGFGGGHWLPLPYIGVANKATLVTIQIPDGAGLPDGVAQAVADLAKKMFPFIQAVRYVRLVVQRKLQKNFHKKTSLRIKI